MPRARVRALRARALCAAPSWFLICISSRSCFRGSKRRCIRVLARTTTTYNRVLRQENWEESVRLISSSNASARACTRARPRGVRVLSMAKYAFFRRIVTRNRVKFRSVKKFRVTICAKFPYEVTYFQRGTFLKSHGGCMAIYSSKRGS